MPSSNACPSRNPLVPALASTLGLGLALGLCCAPVRGQNEPERATEPTTERGAQHGAGAPDPGVGQAMQRPASEAALFRHFAAIRGLSASYAEEKHLSLLAVPLKSRGVLHFVAGSEADGKGGDGEGTGAHLARIVEAPERSRLIISERELRMASKDGVEVIDLRQSDRVRLFVTSLLRVFQGDREALAKHYRVRYTPDATDRSAWQLELMPLGEPLDQILQKLVLHGRGKAVTRIELHEPNGDRTITRIEKVDAQRTFTGAEKRELFGIDAATGGEPGKSK